MTRSNGRDPRWHGPAGKLAECRRKTGVCEISLVEGRLGRRFGQARAAIAFQASLDGAARSKVREARTRL